MELTNIRCILTLFLLSAFRLDIFLPGFYVWKELWMQAIHFRHFRQSRANSSENLIDSYLAFTSRPLFTSGSTWVEFCVACDTTALAPSGFKRTAGINTTSVSAFATRNARYDIIVGPRIFFFYRDTAVLSRADFAYTVRYVTPKDPCTTFYQDRPFSYFAGWEICFSAPRKNNFFT